jgi:hypothetical protein
MARVALLFLPLLVLGIPLHAQVSMGVEGGLGVNYNITNASNRAATVLKGAAGYAVDVSLRYRVNSWLSVEVFPGVVQKGYSIDRTDSLYGEFESFRNTYAQVPLGIGLNYTRGRLTGALDPGLFAGYWLSGRVKGTTADIFSVTDQGGSEQFLLTGYDQRYAFLKARDDRWEWGWSFGFGIRYCVRGPWSLTADGRLEEALSSMEKAIPSYNRTWIFAIGGCWSPKKRTR